MVEAKKVYKVLGISGSLRAKSLNLAAIKYAGTVIPEGRMVLEIASYADIPVYNGDVEDQGMPEAVKRLHAQILAADAILIGCPEYNYSISGALKNAIDWVSRIQTNPWQKKPVAIIGCTAGQSGGVRAIYDLRKVLMAFDAYILTKECNIPANYLKFDKEQNLTDKDIQTAIQKQMVAFVEWTDFVHKGNKQ